MAKKKKTKKEIQADSGLDLIDSVLKKIGVDVHKDIKFLDPEFFVSTGSMALDHILGDGCGLPPGIVEIHGPEGAGKSTLALGLMAQAQKQGLNAYYFDVEDKLTSSMVRTIRDLDPTKVKWPRTKHGTAVIKALDVLLPESPRSVIVIDSVPAMISAAQFRENSDKDFYAQIPKLLTNFLPKARTWVREHQTLLIFLNQLRDNIGVSYGPKKRTPGGNALRYYSDIRLELKVKESIKSGEVRTGQRLKITTKKNCYTRPYQSVEVALMYGYGIDPITELQELGVQFGLVDKSGAWLTYGDYRAQGMDKFIAGLRNNKALLRQLYKEVREHFEVS